MMSNGKKKAYLPCISCLYTSEMSTSWPGDIIKGGMAIVIITSLAEEVALNYCFVSDDIHLLHFWVRDKEEV